MASNHFVARLKCQKAWMYLQPIFDSDDPWFQTLLSQPQPLSAENPSRKRQGYHAAIANRRPWLWWK